MMFKYRISTRDGEEKVVIGATQARGAIKDLLTIHDVARLLIMKGVRNILDERSPVVELAKKVADWIVSNLGTEIKFETSSAISSLPRMDFDNFSIEVVATNSISK